FHSVEIMPLYLSSTDVFLTITVVERWAWRPSPIFRYSDPNFNTWWLTRELRRVYYGLYLSRLNMRGRNETLFLKAQLGYTKEFGIRYRFPYISRRQRWGLAFGGSRTHQDEITAGTRGNKREFITLHGRETRREWKGDVEVTYRPILDVRHAFRLGYIHADVMDSVARAVPGYFADGGRSADIFTLGYSWTHDRRDRRAFPLKGSLLLLRADRYGLPIIGDGRTDLTTFYGMAQRIWRTSDRWSLGAGLHGKVSTGPDLPYYLQQGLGYGDHVRGYEYYVIDGAHYALLKTNALWALVKPREYLFARGEEGRVRRLYVAIYLNAFADVGYVWDKRYAERNPLANAVQAGYGLGVDLVTNFDMVVRAECAVNGLEETGFFLHFAHPF
ncbi:MAG TPA: BamA/TamA family outer membrane protein, partial [Flavobacteriales bacterium]|nr:BamA/TamA family outer membrane protein [Flavobacteriales bacterium]